MKEHYELRFVLSSVTLGYRDEITFCCYAESEMDAFCTAEAFFSYHGIGFVRYIGHRIISKNYRKKFKVGGKNGYGNEE